MASAEHFSHPRVRGESEVRLTFDWLAYPAHSDIRRPLVRERNGLAESRSPCPSNHASRWRHRHRMIALAALTPNRSAALRQDKPPSIAATTSCRR